MKKQSFIITLATIALFFAAAHAAFAAPATSVTGGDNAGLKCDSSGNCTYVPLEPLPGYDQAQPTDLGSFLTLGFRVIFSLSAIFAVMMLAFAGVQYMVSDVAHVKASAMDRAWAAIYGILILAGSWLILNTINPQLLNFNFQVPGSGSIGAPGNTTGVSASGSGGNGTGSSIPEITVTVPYVHIYQSDDTATRNQKYQSLKSQCTGARHIVVNNYTGTDVNGSYVEVECVGNQSQ
ncbi:MAG TPA: pilin [Candidatus Paceibacterota bacterium]|nr:pilin [Candidatus Paceibacterota bacterium]